MANRRQVSSGTHWEEIAGYSRAIRTGNSIQVSGTTATDENNKLVGESNPYEQTMFIIRKIERALQALGASLEDVVRTRIFIVAGTPWEPVARAHGEVFGEIRPANTLVVISALIGEGYLVEMEADALIEESA